MLSLISYQQKLRWPQEQATQVNHLIHQVSFFVGVPFMLTGADWGRGTYNGGWMSVRVRLASNSPVEVDSKEDRTPKPKTFLFPSQLLQEEAVPSVCLTCIFSVAELPHIWNPTEFCAPGASRTLYAYGMPRNGAKHTVLISSAHAHAPVSDSTSLTKDKFKDKIIIKNFMKAIGQH